MPAEDRGALLAGSVGAGADQRVGGSLAARLGATNRSSITAIRAARRLDHFQPTVAKPIALRRRRGRPAASRPRPAPRSAPRPSPSGRRRRARTRRSRSSRAAAGAAPPGRLGGGVDLHRPQYATRWPRRSASRRRLKSELPEGPMATQMVGSRLRARPAPIQRGSRPPSARGGGRAARWPLAGAAAGRSFMPRHHRIFHGVSDTTNNKDFHRFTKRVGAHPAVLEDFYHWDTPLTSGCAPALAPDQDPGRAQPLDRPRRAARDHQPAPDRQGARRPLHRAAEPDDRASRSRSSTSACSRR